MALGVGVWFVQSPSPAHGPVAQEESARTVQVSYVLADAPNASPHDPSDPGHSASLHDLREHAACMRSEGFVPDPSHHGDGWGIIIADPSATGLDLDSPAFRQAMFVTCGPLGGPPHRESRHRRARRPVGSLSSRAWRRRDSLCLSHVVVYQGITTPRSGSSI